MTIWFGRWKTYWSQIWSSSFGILGEVWFLLRIFFAWKTHISLTHQGTGPALRPELISPKCLFRLMLLTAGGSQIVPTTWSNFLLSARLLLPSPGTSPVTVLLCSPFGTGSTDGRWLITCSSCFIRPTPLISTVLLPSGVSSHGLPSLSQTLPRGLPLCWEWDTSPVGRAQRLVPITLAAEICLGSVGWAFSERKKWT